MAQGTAWGEWAIDEIEKLVKFIPEGMRKGFAFQALMPDYNVLVLKNEYIGYIISAIIGTAILLIIFRIVFEIIKRKLSKRNDEWKKE